MNRKRLALGLSLCLGLGVLLFYAWRSPQYALLRMSHAIEDKDPAAFREYVDTGRLVSYALEDLSALEWEKQAEGGLLEFLQSQLKESLGTLLQPVLTSLINREMDLAIAGSPAAESRSTVPQTPSSGVRILAQLEKLRQLKPAVSSGSVAYLRSEGDVAQLGVKLHQAAMKRDFLLNFEMQRTEGRWQVVRLSNLLYVLSELSSGEGELVRQHNAGVQSKIGAALRLGPLVKDREQQALGLLSRTRFSVALENLSRAPLSEIRVVLIRKQEKDDAPPLLVREQKLRVTQGSPTPLVLEGSWQLPTQSDDGLEALDPENLRLVITRAVFEDGIRFERLANPSASHP